MDRSLTVRSLLAGLLIGVLINLSNTYYGLRVGAASQMSTVSGLLSFVSFKLFSRWTTTPFHAHENVLVISTATAVGAMPVTAGFIGIIPALEFLVEPKENGPLSIAWLDLTFWSIGLCLFGLIFASWLRPYFVDKQDLPWPGAKVTAQLVKTLHQLPMNDLSGGFHAGQDPDQIHDRGEYQPLLAQPADEWKSQLNSLVGGGLVSGILTVAMSFAPVLHQIPLFGKDAATNWLWSVDLAPGFFGQGIITGPVIPLHMLAGAIVGWGILSPYARSKGYSPGDIDDWETGPRGWIIWISLAALLADATVKMSWIIARPIWQAFYPGNRDCSVLRPALSGSEESQDTGTDVHRFSICDLFRALSSYRPSVLNSGFLLAVVVCLLAGRSTFGDFIPWYYTLLSIFLSLPMAVVGVRSLAETDYNPESALVSQIVFAWLISPDNPSGVIINLISAAVAQAGANQAGDLSYDLKVGSLVGAQPTAQFIGQVVGSIFGAFTSVGIYKFYASRSQIPGPSFRIPSSFLVLSTARLLMGQGLPEGVAPFALATAICSAIVTVVKMRFQGRWWEKIIPSGVAFAIGIYNTPSFTITRTLGGLFCWFYGESNSQQQGPLILLASGLVLGESLAGVLLLILRRS